MASAYTGVGAVDLDQAAYDLHVYTSLRRNAYFDGVADVKSTSESMAGSSVIFNIHDDLAAATATLNESTDVDAVAAADNQVTVTLVEKGNAMITTALLRGTSYVRYDPVVADLVAYNAAISLDVIAGAELVGGSNVLYGGAATSRDTVIPTAVATAAKVRQMRARLRGRNNMPFGGNAYAAFIHPDVSYDLTGETGAAAWRDPHTYSQPGEIWAGEIGMFESFRFVETPSPSLLIADAGSSTTLTDVYVTLFLGRQCLAKGWSKTDGNTEVPQFVMGPVTDKLRRNVPVGWYWLGGYKRFREAAIDRLETASTIGANS